MSLEACAIYECNLPATKTGLCVTHGNAPAPPGISEPALEERARRAGDQVTAPPPAPILDMGESPFHAYDPGQAEHFIAPSKDPAQYVLGCLRGDHGAMRRAVAEAMLRAVEQGLRAL